METRKVKQHKHSKTWLIICYSSGWWILRRLNYKVFIKCQQNIELQEKRRSLNLYFSAPKALMAQNHRDSPWCSFVRRAVSAATISHLRAHRSDPLDFIGPLTNTTRTQHYFKW